MQYINTNKLEKLNLNKDNTFIVLDFDKTITSFESKDSWDVCGGMLDNEFKDKLNKYYEYYGPIETDYSMDEKQKEKYMVEWYDKCMNLYYEYHLTKEKLEESIRKSKIIFREGAKKFIEEANKNNIPIIILSAGIGNVIEGFLKLNNCYFENIYIISNFIEFDKIGNMKKFNSRMIHSLNKTMEGHLSNEFECKTNERKFGILAGDLIDDKKMVPKDMLENVISVGFLNNENNLDVYNKNFDIVLTNEDATFSKINDLV